MMLLQGKFQDPFRRCFGCFQRNKVANTNYKSFLFGFTVSSFGTVQRAGYPVIAISFLSAGLMALQSGIAMVYGINLSTAGSAWLVGYFGLKTKISFICHALDYLRLGIFYQ